MQTTTERTRLTPREWTISIILHVVIFGLLIWFTPARQVLESLGDKNQPAPKPPRQDPTQVKEVVQAISKEQADAAKEHVKQLMDMEKKLDKLAKDRLDNYKQQVQPIAANAAKQALDLLNQIPPGQDATMAAQKQLSQQQQASLTPDLANKMDGMNPLRDQMTAAQMAVGQTQIKTQELQEKAQQLIHFLGQDTAASQAEQKAIDAQNAAAVSQQKSSQIQAELIQDVWNLNNHLSDVANEKNRLAQTQADLSATNAAVAQDQAATAAAKTQVDAASTAYNQAHDQAAANNTPDNQARQNDLHQKLDQAQQALNQATSQQNQAMDKAKQLQAQIDNPTGVQRATAGLADAQAKFAELQKELQASQDQSETEQAAAKQAQADAINQVAALANNPNAKPAEQATPSELATDKEVDPSTLDGKDLGQVYDTATQTQDRIADKFRVYRATELASIQKMTLADALQATQVAKTDREKLDTKLLSDTTDTKDFNAYKDEVIKAKQQIQSMVDSSNTMVTMAENQKNVGTGDVSLQEDNYNKMVASATEDANAAGKDLTAMTAEKKGHHGHGGQEEGSSDVDDAADMEKQGDGGNGGDAPPDVGNPQTGAGMSSTPINAELPDMDYEHLKPVATRRISETGPHHADWLYVDSWYFIGPFPNAGRANLYTKFPPESIIDLDAAYPGKNGQTLRWVYTQWNSPNLRPARDLEDAPAIYYAYTELYFDQPQDLWIATGSDDKGTMWLNSVMVWNSNDVLKGWQPNEGYRKVHFKKGINRILYRLENGQLVAAFSLMISVKKS
jgi:hypothetical protein